jgi:uncharacterized protein (TIGR03067 family)
LVTATGRGAPPAKGPAELQGTWKLLSLELEGKTLDVSRREARWVIRGNKVFRAGEELAVLTTDAAARTIDLKFNDPSRVYEGIYAVEADTWKVCVNVRTEGVRERPLKLTTEGRSQQFRTLVFERLKAGEGDAEASLRGFAGVAIGTAKGTKDLVVVEVFPGGPAAKAGLKKDDLIFKIGNTKPGGVQEAVEVVGRARPGDQILFHIRRAKQERDITVRVGVFPFLLLEE